MGVRDETKEETREALVRSAIALIAEQGVDRPSLDAICAHAGFTRGAFYVHFRDRDELLVAVLDRVGRTFLEGVIGDGRQGLRAMSLGFIASIGEGRYPLMGAGSVRPTQLLDACARSKHIRARYVELVHETIGRVATAAEHDRRVGMLRKEADPQTLASLLLALVIGAQTMLDLGATIDLAEVASLLASVLAPSKKRKKKRGKKGPIS